jgi:hypothetical protein
MLTSNLNTQEVWNKFWLLRYQPKSNVFDNVG